MKIISFAWTVPPLLEGKKTVTRRFWNNEYARRFKKGDLVAAYNKSPRFGGKQIATIKLTCNPYKEFLSRMTDEEEKAEGGLWGSAKAFADGMGGKHLSVFVIRFEVLKSICNGKETGDKTTEYEP